MKLLGFNFGDVLYFKDNVVADNPVGAYWDLKKHFLPDWMEKGLISRQMLANRIDFLNASGKYEPSPTAPLIFVSSIGTTSMPMGGVLIAAFQLGAVSTSANKVYMILANEATKQVVYQWAQHYNKANPSKAPIKLAPLARVIWVIYGDNQLNKYLEGRAICDNYVLDYGKGHQTPTINLLDEWNLNDS
jgi:hypothetical protein